MDKKLYMNCTKEFAVYSLIVQGMINESIESRGVILSQNVSKQLP